MRIKVAFFEIENTLTPKFEKVTKYVGLDGKSAYEIAVENGFEGTEAEWLESLNGADGKSAYEVAVDAGYKGTIEEYYADLSSFGEKAELAKTSAEEAQMMSDFAGADRAIAEQHAQAAKTSEGKAKESEGKAKESEQNAYSHYCAAQMMSDGANYARNEAAEHAQSAKASAEEALKHSSQADSYSNSAYTSYIMAEQHAQASKTSAEEAKKSEDMAKQAVAKLLINGKSSGKVAAIDDAANMSLLGLTVNDGTAVETIKCIGKNFFHRDYDRSVTHIGVTAEWDVENQEFILNGTTTTAGDIKLVTPMPIDWVVGENYTVSVRHIGGTATLAEGSNTTTYSWGIFQDNAAKYVRGAVYYTEFFDLYDFTAKAFELDANRSHILYFQCWRPGTVFDNYRVKVQIEKGDTVTDWEAYREETVTIDNAKSLMLQKGYNNIIAVPMADITAEYVVDLQMYIDKKIESLK